MQCGIVVEVGLDVGQAKERHLRTLGRQGEIAHDGQVPLYQKRVHAVLRTTGGAYDANAMTLAIAIVPV